jgi:hypothetical protein
LEWNSSHQQVFDKIKKVIGTEMHVLLCYPNFNKSFPIHLYTDSSDHTLWAFIMQDRKPVAFYLLMLNTAQNWYTITELLEEYGVTFEYLYGKIPKIFVADAFSCLDIDSLQWYA